MRNFDLLRVTQALYGQPWAILPEKLAELVAVLSRRKGHVGGGYAAEDDSFERAERDRAEVRAKAIGAKLRDVGGMLVEQVGKVAILPMMGTISQRPSFMTKFSGGTSAEQFASSHAALLDDGSVKSIVWDVDSPGGSVAGVPEAAARLLAMKGEKKTVAVSNAMMASAAYWLASSADEVVAAPSSLTGSIGVVAVHEDHSKANELDGVQVNYIHAGKYKVEGNPDQPLSAEGAQALQQTVDDYYGQFVKGVGRARGVTEAKVKTGYGEGRVLTAQRAVDAGLADRVATLLQVLTRLGAYEGGSVPGASAEPLPASTRTALARQRQAEVLV
jgi:signal peptide peptidase SppA